MTLNSPNDNPDNPLVMTLGNIYIWGIGTVLGDVEAVQREPTYRWSFMAAQVISISY